MCPKDEAELLNDARRAIDEVDSAMAHLFEERMGIVAQVAAHKAERGLPVCDPEREAIVLEQGANLVGEELRPYYERFQKSVMEISREYQQHLISRVSAGEMRGARL